MKHELPGLKAELATLDERIARARERELASAIAQAREIIETFGLTAFDLGLVPVQQVPRVRRVARTFKPRGPRLVHPPLYRNPATGETWDGRGAPPEWIMKSADDFILRSA